MFVGSVALYLTVRKSSLVKVPMHLTNLAMFAIPLVAYLLIGASGSHTYSLSAYNWVILIVAATIFAYAGNVISLKAIEIAPNPGYSLMLSKSYVLFTTTVAITLLGAELNPRKLIAILFVIGFSALIMINPKAAKHVSSTNGSSFPLAPSLRGAYYRYRRNTSFRTVSTP